jgi:hypothetical protein
MKLSKLPIQSAPVERTIAGSPISNGDGVEASGFLGDLLSTLGGLAGKLPF